MFELTTFADPFKALDRFENSFWGRSPLPDFKTDIRDNGDTLSLFADLPGMKKEDIHVDVEDGYLTISAERNNEHEQNKNGYVRRERSYGKFSRSFDVTSIDTDSIKAAYKDGVLELTLPKKQAATPPSRRLTID